MKSTLILFTALILAHTSAFAGASSCLTNEGSVVSDSNTQVLNWLHNTPKNFSARAYVEGIVVKSYADQTNHAHFAIDLNGDGQGDLEVIYQYDAGKLPKITPGMKITSCGDYITAKNSPNGGIIHWVHCNSRGGPHADGYLSINGSLFGFSPDAASGERCVRSAPQSF